MSGEAPGLQLRATRVLHLLAPADYGGLESVVLSLARAQRDAGLRVTVAALVDSGRTDHPFVQDLEREGIAARSLEVPPRGYLQERRRVGALLRELRCDVLHTHGYRPDVVDSGVGRRMGLATVTTVHGFTGSDWRNRLYEWVERRWFRRFQAVVAVSGPLRLLLLRAGVPEGRLYLIRNGWMPTAPFLGRREARQALGLPEGERVVGWVGRFTGEKGPEVMIDVLARAEAGGVCLSMIGAGPLEASLRERAASLGIGERVRWHGVVRGAGRHLAAFDALLLTSWTEGTPMVLLEAMAAGVPIIATAVGGVPDVVSSREAILAPAGDRAALAEGIRAILADSATATERATCARARLESEFALEPWVRRYSEVYRAALDRVATT